MRTRNWQQRKKLNFRNLKMNCTENWGQLETLSMPRFPSPMMRYMTSYSLLLYHTNNTYIIFLRILFLLQANNAVIRFWGEKRMEPNLRNHVELVELTGIADTRKGTWYELEVSDSFFSSSFLKAYYDSSWIMIHLALFINKGLCLVQSIFLAPRWYQI